jgi:hypothetical protein
MDILGIWVGAILTLLVFSYLFGDSPLFRLAQAIFVGVAIGYGLVVAVQLILIPNLFNRLIAPDPSWLYFIPLVMGILLLLKVRTAWAPLGNISIAFLFGVGAALALGGALTGALVPQVGATLVSLTPAQNWDSFVAAALLAFGTIGALLTFRFVANQQRWAARGLELTARGWSYFGRWFILIAFGAIFADTAVSRISILISRIYFLLHDWLGLVR